LSDDITSSEEPWLQRILLKWLDKTKNKCPSHDQGERLDRFVAVVHSNPAFHSICSAAMYTNQQADDTDESDGGPPDIEDNSSSSASSVINDDDSTELDHEIELLFEAAMRGCFVTLKDSLCHRVNSTMTESGITPLHIAVEYGYYEDVKALLEAKAEIKADRKGVTPLHVAAASSKPNTEIAKLLIEYMKSVEGNPLINATFPTTSNDEPTRGNTALHVAADNKHISHEFIETLAVAGIDLCIKNAEDETAFHVAARAENPDVIVWMLEVFSPVKYGWKMAVIETDDDADNNNDDNDSRAKMLGICARSGNAKAVAMLIEYGADISEDVLFQLIDESV